MNMFCYSSLFLSLATAVLASQPSASDPIPAPLRDLTWGQLNFLHTTDTHGWLAGHLQEYVHLELVRDLSSSLPVVDIG